MRIRRRLAGAEETWFEIELLLRSFNVGGAGASQAQAASTRCQLDRRLSRETAYVISFSIAYREPTVYAGYSFIPKTLSITKYSSQA